MTREEFVAKFHVGQKITTDTQCTRCWFKIICYGERKFFAVCHDGLELCFDYDQNWLPYEEPKTEKVLWPICSNYYPITHLNLRDGTETLGGITYLMLDESRKLKPVRVVLKNRKSIDKNGCEYLTDSDESADLYIECDSNLRS